MIAALVAATLLAPASCVSVPLPVVVLLDPRRHERILAHVREALDVGEPFVLHIDRADADRHRAASLRGWPTRRGWHRDEYPPAATAEGGAGADVQFVPSSENESAGAVMRARLAPFCDGQPFVFGPVTA
jgi:hypothetical protein